MEVFSAMFITSKTLFTGKSSLGLILLALAVLLPAAKVVAEPYLALKNNLRCSSCHVNPIGGGSRNDYGSYYGSQVLPQTGVKWADPGKLTDAIRLGGNIRSNFTYFEPQNADSSSSFDVQSAQIYMHIQPKNSRFSFYLDQMVAPGSAVSREAFVMAKLGKSHYLKVGKIMMPYGIRLEDDGAFVRQATQSTFDNSDMGVEFDLEFKKGTINMAVTNGNGGATNPDDQLQYILRGEYVGTNWRLGGSYLLNQGSSGDRNMANVFAGLNFLGFNFLAEYDQVKDDSINVIPGISQEQDIYFFEINRELTKGINLKLSLESMDPESNIDENDRSRTSLLLEYTPYSYIQFRGGIRVSEDIPQRDLGNSNQAFIQAHVYF